MEPVVNDDNDNESQRILANPGEDIEFAFFSSIAHLRKGELPRWGKGRGKPLPREGGKRGLMGFWIEMLLNHLSPRGLVGFIKFGSQNPSKIDPKSD